MKALSSKTRLRILRIVGEDPTSAIDVYRKYNTKFSERKHRESIYRDLEVLLSAQLLKKNYDQRKKQIVYLLLDNHLTLNLVSGEIENSK